MSGFAAVLAAAALWNAEAVPPPGARAREGPLSGARLLQITLPSRDLPGAVRFYRDVLGLKLLFRVKGAVFFDVGGVRLRIEAGSTPGAGGYEIYFDDPGLSRAGALASRGVRFLGPPQTVQRSAGADLQLLEFNDPDGNALALMGEVARR
jgi:methylmalonyl-CoA/ethylmalonyl-CoA epimerase